VSAVAERPRWHGSMFGLAVESEIDLAGCRPAPRQPGHPVTRVRLAERAQLTSASGSPRRRPVASRPAAGGGRVAEVLADASGGYFMPAPGFGAFHVSGSGRLVRAAPNAVAQWRWQRYLIGRVLPFAAVLRGLEPVHAAAVALAGGAVLLAGDPGTGKSTLAAELVRGGLSFLADDVVALSRDDSGPRAHPGPGLLWLRRSAAARLGPAALRGLGARMGGDRRGVRLAVAVESGPRPVAAVCLLQAGPPDSRPSVTEGPAGHPARLLASTFNSALANPERLERQLDIYAAVARTARILEVTVPAGGDPAAVAAAIVKAVSG
jgi:HPr serine kinase-like protein